MRMRQCLKQSRQTKVPQGLCVGKTTPSPEALLNATYGCILHVPKP